MRSAHEVRAYLLRRGAAPEAAARALTACRAQGLIDDAACARLWADHWARRGYAAAAIRAKLSEKGLDARTIDRAVDDLVPSTDDAARARALLDRRLERAPRASRPALARLLTARGFDPDVTEQVLDASLGPAPSHAES